MINILKNDIQQINKMRKYYVDLSLRFNNESLWQ